jgi:ABC-type phosphate transport system permease subunit
MMYDMIYDLIYLLTAVGLTPDGSSTVHIYKQNNTQNNIMKQNTQNGTYITIIIIIHTYINITIRINNLQN